MTQILTQITQNFFLGSVLRAATGERKTNLFHPIQPTVLPLRDLRSLCPHKNNSLNSFNS